jgi:hypothetical protein
MGGQPWAADWEHIVGRDLVPHLVPGGEPLGAQRAGMAALPNGAQVALSVSLGRVEPGDLLVVPAAAWRWQKWRRRSLYTPLSVAGIGEQSIGLWVRALPAPGVRVQLPFSGIAAIEHHADGPWHVLAVTGPAGRMLVRYREDGRTGADGWIRRLRLRAAPAPAPVPRARPGGRDLRRGLDLDAFLLDPGGEIIRAGWRSRARRAACLLAVTSRELIIMQSRAGRGLSSREIRRTLYLPRRSFQGVAAQARTVWLHSADTDMNIDLWSGKAAAAVSRWLGQVLTSGDRSGAGSWQDQPGGLPAWPSPGRGRP